MKQPPFFKYILIGLVVAIFSFLVFSTIRNYNGLMKGLPPKITVLNEAEAIQKTHGRRYVEVLGTGSMSPYIPPAKVGEDPVRTVVAVAVFDAKKTYNDIKVGDLVNYRIPQVKQFSSILHQAVEKDSDGWIMSGIGNSYSENLLRLTEENFIGITEEIYVWPPYDK